MTTPRSQFAFGQWVRELFQKISGHKAPRPETTRGGPAAAESVPDAVLPFLKKHRKTLASLNLEASAKGFVWRDTRPFAERGISTMLQAIVEAPYQLADFSQPELRRAEQARLWLTQIRDGLATKASAALGEAATALTTLIEATLDPARLRWLGGEEAARKQYLNVPPQLQTHDVIATCRRRHKDVQAQAGQARTQFLTDRLAKVPNTRLSNKTLSCRYQEPLPFLSSALDLELNIEKFLSHRDMDRLVEASEADVPATVEALLASSRQALIAKLKEQLRDLARRIKSLPHIELLADAEIAATAAPYYGGINRDLKKRRAKSALVAVEERAREAKYHEDVAKLNEHRGAYADVASYYPLARSMQRKLVLYVGPTNSGKTWRALNELAEAHSGAYLAPLRLLALEGQEELEKRGKPTSFLTGEERDLKTGALFVSSTIEMLNLEFPVEAVVVDEVQLLADERRGWAWLSAVVGAPASKVIMTGSPDCVELVKELAKYLGEELTIHECQRYNELRVAEAPMRLREIRPGTAIVCFSRRDVQRIKNTIQENSDLKVAVVYGNLSPQVRREEARRFRSGEAEILVATDAIAMGLNLPIKEVLFYTTEKFNGDEMVELSVSDIRQIGGRAGRYGFASFGVVNALNEKSLEVISQALSTTAETLAPPFYVAPGRNHIRIISEVLGTDSLERILTFFDRAIEFSDDRFARSNIDDLSYLSTFVDERLPFLEVTERMTIASAPVAIRNETVLGWFLERMLRCFRDPNHPEEEYERLDDLFEAAGHFNRESARNQLDLRDAEDYLKTLTVYAWLAYRYPDVFTQLDDCERCREEVNAFVERSLRATMEKRCATCEVKLPANTTFTQCDDCYAKTKTEGAGRPRRTRGKGRAAARRA